MNGGRIQFDSTLRVTKERGARESVPRSGGGGVHEEEESRSGRGNKTLKQRTEVDWSTRLPASAVILGSSDR